MTGEDLFEAIGTVEASRLAKSEQGSLTLCDDGLEEPTMKKATISTGRVLRNLLVAAVIMSLLAVTAYAVAGYVIYDDPEEMISAIFGNNTGFDSGEYTEIPDPERPGGLLAVLPEYDRVEADPEVVKEDVAPYVSPVGKSITFKDMTLTVDSFLYDSGTKCGIVTYTLTNPPAYETQYDGEISYQGRAPVDFNQYGYDYIIQEKTTDNTLAAAYYFRYDPAMYGEEWKKTFGVKEDFSVGLYVEDPDMEGLDERCMEEVQAQYTPEEAIEKAWEITKQWGTEERFRQDIGYFGEEGAAYRLLRDELVNNRSEGIEEASTSPDRITFDCSRSSGIENITLGQSGVTVSPVSMQVDTRKMDFLKDQDSNDEIVISFADGTEYLVEGENAEGNSVLNYLFALWSPVEVREDADDVFLTCMFNRVIDLDQVASVKINGIELTRD